VSGHIFISYARQDGREYAERLDNDLASAGFATWRDTRSINEYQDFSAEIENAIRDASHVAVCVTPSIDANPHSFVRREVIYADSKEKPIIPLVFPNADVPTLVNHLTWIPFGEGKKPGQKLDYESGLSQLLARLKEAVKPTPQRESNDPYREYLKALYDRIVYYLNQTVFSLITLSSEATPSAVEEVAAQALPMAFFDMAGIGGKSNEKAQFQNFYEAFDKYGGRVLLLGEPGAGKTTTLMAFARDAVWKRLENPSLPLPILAPIATWDSQKQTPLADWLAEAIPMLKREDVAHLVDAGNALLMLDGLDELGGEREEGDSNPFPASPASGGGERRRYDPRQRFLQIVLENNQVVATCRVKDYEQIGEKIALKGAVTLQALNDEQMREYLREMPDLWAALEGDNDLREVARTPLLLSLFTYAFAGLDEEAKKLRDLSRGDLRDKIFETYVQRRYEHEERKLKVRGEVMAFTLEEIYEVLGRITVQDLGDLFQFEEQSESNYVYSIETIPNLWDDEHTKSFIDLATLLHILIPHTNYGFRFIHLLLRDYFAFSYAVTHLEDSTWYGKENIINPANALSRLNDTRAVEPLIVALHNDNKWIRREAAFNLGHLGDLRAVNPLISILNDESASVRVHTVQALGKLSDLSVVPPLLRALQDANWFVRVSAAQALGQIGDSRAIPRLIELLSDIEQGATEYERQHVFDAAAEALERIGTSEALEAVARWRRELGE
jgi:hypothetical protein